MKHDQSPRAIVVGAGLSGLATARALSMRGARVERVTRTASSWGVSNSLGEHVAVATGCDRVRVSLRHGPAIVPTYLFRVPAVRIAQYAASGKHAISSPAAIAKILAHLGLATSAPLRSCWRCSRRPGRQGNNGSATMIDDPARPAAAQRAPTALMCATSGR